MKQYFKHYEQWEDYKNGMYRDINKDEVPDLTNIAVGILSNKKQCTKAMERVINEWPVSTKVNLTNKGINQKAWLGQAACCIEGGVPEEITRQAWCIMNDAQRYEANKIALQIIRKWKDNFYYKGDLFCQRNT